MQKIEHIKVTAKDGAAIPVMMYNIEDSNKKGIVIICHGFSEHSGSYLEHAERLRQGGYASAILDQRGHGKPPEGARRWQGQVPHYQCFLDDVASVTEYVKEKAPGTPIAIYGHSMGGNIVTNTILRLPPEQAKEYFCAILESPWFELYKPLNPSTKCLLRFLSKVAPRFRYHRKKKHDDDSDDPYTHRYISMRMATGVMEGCMYALENANKLPIKTFLAYADNELVVCKKTIRYFAMKAGDMVTLKKYVSNHSIYSGVSHEEYCRDLIAFFDSNV